jgi:hypothetical protein
MHTGQQTHQGKVCGRAFVLVPEHHLVTEAQRAGRERLVLERISLRGSCRVRGGGLRWLVYFRVDRFTAAPEHRYVQPASGTHRGILPRLAAEGRALELRREKGESAVGLDCQGRRHSPNDCLPRGRSQPPECARGMGEAPCRVSRAGQVLY